METRGIVRPATRDDVPAIRDLYNEGILKTIGTAEYLPVSLESRYTWFEDRMRGGYPVMVYDAGEVLGYSVLSPWVAREGYRFTAETGIYVTERAWGNGIATELLSGLVAAARGGEFHSLVARVAVENEASLRVHLRQGFVEIGRFPEVMFKFDRWIDIIMLQLRLRG